MSVSRSKRELWPDGGPRSRVLVVDDDALVCRSLRQLLGSQGYETACATGARQAVQMLDEQGFDLVLCDVRMPGESGLDLVERINEEHPEVAVLMVSGLDDRQVAERALELGAYDYVVKPFRPNDMFVAVANALRRRKLVPGNSGRPAAVGAGDDRASGRAALRDGGSRSAQGAPETGPTRYAAPAGTGG